MAQRAEKIVEYIPKVLHLFEEKDFTEKAEKVVGSRLSIDFFIATLVTSVEYGAEAIDISKEQDLFGIEREPIDALYFIGHEFIIYLLFDVLKEENAFKELGTWNVTEGLAEFYLKQVMGDTRFLDTQKKYVEAVAEYELQFGPLTMKDTDTERGWAWVETPWPWEKEDQYVDL